VALAALCVVASVGLALQQITLLFLIISIGGHGWNIAGDLFAWTYAQPEAVLVAGVCGFPCLLLLARRVPALGRRGLKTLLVTYALLHLTAQSYRLPAAALGAVGLFFLWRHVRMSWAILGVASLISLGPADVSLRMRAGGPRWAEAIAGDLTMTPARFEASGERVWLGGGRLLMLNEPRWVLVW
jgi:hypothetical protein